MSSVDKPNFDESTGNKTFRKIKENPMVPIGMTGFFLAVAYGIKNYKNRPKNMSTSMYVMRFRVFAQSIAVGSMFVGIGYTILKEHWTAAGQETSKSSSK
ncbi:HIG1 domain family member 1A, mitochondrial-like [Physella acuta]|uniref:HIG1 domain family member 1A, mitochondrial-like n=1 Tax=Physella acuta TaxID=109671 RepID=UPI0027DC93B9|nr:HIG1 domain family member 1A, mitochondrial-like [Physella acuta]